MPNEGYRVCDLGYPGPLRDRLVAAVLRGEKTATSSLLAEWEQEEDPLPESGGHRTLIDSGGRAVGVIEIRSADVIRLGDADLRLAIAEGEGFGSVAQWRVGAPGVSEGERNETAPFP